MKRFVVLLIGSLLLTAAARAWPSCSGNWIQVPAGTSTANGAIVTENGQTFQCQKPTPTPTPTATNSNTSTNSNANANNNANSNTNSNKNTNTSASNSASTASASQEQQQTANGGSATATGGASQSTVKNSGNSSNSNVNTANGGAGGLANAAASNNSSGNQTSVSENNITNIPRQTASAIAPDTIPTSPCFKSFSGAGQGPAFGFSFGGGKIDKGCDDRETARLFAVAGNRLAFAKIMCDTPAAKRARLTIDDCSFQVPVPVPVPVVALPVPVSVTPPTIVVPAPQVVIQTPAPVPTATNEGTVYNIGTCKFFNRRPSNACYRLLDDAVRAMESRPNARLIMVGPLETTKVFPYIDGKISRSRIELRLDDDANNNLTIETWSVQ